MTEAKFSFTCKLAGDLFTVRGDSVEEFVHNLDGAVHAVGNAQNLQAVSTAIGGLGAGTTVVSQQPAPVAAPAAPFAPAAPVQQSAQVTQSGVPTPSCVHGPRTHRTGNGKRGPWAAWFCPTPKDTPGQCDPVWVD